MNLLHCFRELVLDSLNQAITSSPDAPNADIAKQIQEWCKKHPDIREAVRISTTKKLKPENNISPPNNSKSLQNQYPQISKTWRDRERLEGEKERDRKIENLIYVVSAGLAGAGIAASSSGYLTAGSKNGAMTIQWLPNPHQSIHPFTKILGISIGIGVLLGFAVWGIRKWIESLDKDNRKSS